MFAAAVYTAVITNTANEREKDKEERAASSEWNFSLSLSLLHFLPPRLGLPVDEDEEDDDDEEEDGALDLLDLDLEDDEAAGGGAASTRWAGVSSTLVMTASKRQACVTMPPSPATPPAAAARQPSAVAPSFAAMASAQDTTSRLFLAEAASRERFVTHLPPVMIHYVLLSTKAEMRQGREPKGHGENVTVVVIRPC